MSVLSLKNLSTMAVSVAMALSITACGGSEKPAAAGDAKTEAAGAETKAAADAVKLRFSHFWPATSSIQKEVFEPWAKKIQEESGGRLIVEIYPSAQLSKPQATYDAAVKGMVDIGSQAQGYTNGRFPLTQITELPGLSSSASQMGCMMQTLYDNGTIASEYEDSHLLFMYGAGPGTLHTTDKLIEKPADMKGLRIRRPSAVAGDLIESMGAQPVGMPAGEVYTSLQKGVMDGLSFPWEATETFRINEVAKNHTNIPFYSSGLMVTMNKAKYDSLPDDLKKVLDDNSGMDLAMQVGKVFDERDKAVIDKVKAEGHKVAEIPDPLNDPDWAGPLKKGTEKYLSDVSATGKDANAVYEAAKAASEACKAS